MATLTERWARRESSFQLRLRVRAASSGASHRCAGDRCDSSCDMVAATEAGSAKELLACGRS